MAGAIYGSGFLEVRPEVSGFASGLKSKLSGPIATAGAALGGALAAGLAGAFATGIAAYKIGETFDSAFDTIRVGTGATGTALAGLQDEFRDVVANVPTDFGSAATAIADLNTRLGLTGDDLEGVSSQMIEATRLLGGDLATNIATTSRTMGDWGVSSEDMEGRLDQLFRASQATGIGFDTLSDQLVKYGAPLRQLGFDFETSAALLGKFEKEGVNAELVMGSMRIALGKMARDGEDAQETFQRVVGEIEAAGSVSEANALALELFGARAGPDMAAAIREGRFEVGDLIDTIANGGDTIMGVAAETESFSQKWQKFKNRVLLAIEPIATRVFQTVGKVFDQIAPKVEAWISDTLLPAFERLGAWWDANGPAIQGFISRTFTALGQAIEVARPIVQGIVSAITGLVSSFSSSAEGAGAFASQVSAVFEAMRERVALVIEIVRDVVGGLTAWFSQNEGKTSAIWEKIRSVITVALEAIAKVTEAITEALAWVWENFGDNILRFISGAFDAISSVISGALSIIQGIFDTFIGLFTGDWSRMKDGLLSIWDGLWEGVSGLVSGALDAIWALFDDWLPGILDWFGELPGRVWDALGDLGSTLWDAGSDLISGFIEGIKAKAGGVVDAIERYVLDRVPGFVKDFFGISSPSKLMMGFGEEIPAGLALGIRRGADSVTSAMASMTGGVGTIGLPNLGFDPQPAGFSGGFSVHGDIVLQGTPSDLVDAMSERVSRELNL